MPAPYTKPHPIIIRTATREPSLIRAAKMGWPAFFGIFGSDPREQMRMYRQALDEANHPPAVVENCLRWSSFDWLSCVVAKTDEEAKEREAVAKAEQMAIRRRYIARYGVLEGPTMKAAPGQATATYAAGGDMTDVIAGSPDTVAAKVQQLADIGIGHLHVRFLGEWAGETRQVAHDSAVLFANEVMPRFGAAVRS